MPTTIEWTLTVDECGNVIQKGETWNPVTGCTKVSAGCAHCYAQTFAERWRGIPGHPYEEGFDLTLRPERLDEPLGWRKRRMIFVCSMSDLFHEDVPFEFVDQVFDVMWEAKQHIFQVLTKRPSRMAAWFGGSLRWLEDYKPPGHVWVGTTVENQQAADERIPLLLQVPAAIRFISVEPMLSAVDISPGYLGIDHPVSVGITSLDWLLCGAESGPGARPMDLEWARSLRDQCRAAGVPFFMKQLGSFWARETGSRWPDGHRDVKGACMENWPEDLRVREYPHDGRIQAD